jgi:hypothetical protein
MQMKKVTMFAAITFMASASFAYASEYESCTSASLEYDHGKMLNGQTCDDGQWRGRATFGYVGGGGFGPIGGGGQIETPDPSRVKEQD